MNITKMKCFSSIQFKKTVFVSMILLLFLVVVFATILFSRIRTVSSIKNVDGDFYTVNYYADYKLDKVLEKGVKSVEDVEKIMSSELFFGYPIKTNEDLFACSAFAAKTPDGKKIVGRNFDYANAGALLVYTQPANGYRSYSMVSLAHLGVSKEKDTMPETLVGKVSILASPYGCVDGLNEKGLSVSVLQLETEPTRQNTGKKDIITTVAVRMLLDKCSTTNEAIAMLKEYDMYSSAGEPYHLLLSDASGNTVVAEWPDNTLNVVKQNIATNFQLSKGKDFKLGIGHDRYDIIKNNLTSSNFIVEPKEAMNILKKASVKWNGEWGTEWSVVYHINDFSVDVCNDMNYKKINTFTPE